MLRRYASHLIALLLITLVAGACLVRTTDRTSRRGQPSYVEKHKHQKHKHKKAKKMKHRKHRH